MLSPLQPATVLCYKGNSWPSVLAWCQSVPVLLHSASSLCHRIGDYSDGPGVTQKALIIVLKQLADGHFFPKRWIYCVFVITGILKLHFRQVIPTFPERAWGGIAARLSVPNRTNTQQCYQSIEKTGWVENLYTSLQSTISVNRRWKAKISDTSFVWFSVDKSTWGKSPFQFQCLCWLSQHMACQVLLIGSS